MTFRSKPSIARLVVVVLGLLVTGCGNHACRCHTGHNDVSWNAAYTTLEENCYGYDKHRVCTPYTQHHPESCSSWFICDLWCNDYDKGKLESHPRHGTIYTPTVNHDPARCTNEGVLR